jgi:hypothetical protein
MVDDDFDFTACRLTPERLAEIQKLKPERPGKVPRPARPGAFVKLPYEQTLATASRRDASLAVLVELAFQAFKRHRNQVPLANAALRSVGVSSDAKVRALRRLEADGMVSVDWRGGRKTPLVTLLWL